MCPAAEAASAKGVRKEPVAPTCPQCRGVVLLLVLTGVGEGVSGLCPVGTAVSCFLSLLSSYPGVGRGPELEDLYECLSPWPERSGVPARGLCYWTLPDQFRAAQ